MIQQAFFACIARFEGDVEDPGVLNRMFFFFFLNFGMNFDFHCHCIFHGNYFFALLSLVNAKGRQETSECSISTVTLFSLYCFPAVESIVPNSTTLLPNCGVNFTRKSLPVWHISVYAKRPTTLLLSA